jgi:hypothetical protein
MVMDIAAGHLRQVGDDAVERGVLDGDELADPDRREEFPQPRDCRRIPMAYYPLDLLAKDSHFTDEFATHVCRLLLALRNRLQQSLDLRLLFLPTAMKRLVVVPKGEKIVLLRIEFAPLFGSNFVKAGFHAQDPVDLLPMGIDLRRRAELIARWCWLGIGSREWSGPIANQLAFVSRRSARNLVEILVGRGITFGWRSVRLGCVSRH